MFDKSQQRKIIHVDMDAFYASVEQRDNPSLRGVPLAVGGTSGRGVIAAASYEARQFGVRSAMSVKNAIRKCPRLHFVKPDFQKYKAVSQEIRAIFLRYTDLIEPLSLDEAYLDVTYANFSCPSATLIAQQIKNDISNELNLIASAGVSYNKFLAKIASDQDKPDGLFVIPPEEGVQFTENLSIDDFFGVGKVTAQKMNELGIYFGRDLLSFSKIELMHHFGKNGQFLYEISRGIDNRIVNADRERKSIGAENTFLENIDDELSINEKLTAIFETFWERYNAFHKNGKTITLKIKFADFESITRSKTDVGFIKEKHTARSILFELLKEQVEVTKPIRLMGVSISNFESLPNDYKNKDEKQLILEF